MSRRVSGIIGPEDRAALAAVSGSRPGQTGADQGGLEAAARFGSAEAASAAYPERTERNVPLSDGTVAFAAGGRPARDPALPPAPQAPPGVAGAAAAAGPPPTAPLATGPPIESRLP